MQWTIDGCEFETPPDHEDYEGIQKALHQVKAVADIVNNSVREVEHIMKTAQIQACLVGYDVRLPPSPSPWRIRRESDMGMGHSLSHCGRDW